MYVDPQLIMFLSRLRGMHVPYSIVGDSVIIAIKNIPGVKDPFYTGLANKEERNVHNGQHDAQG